MTEQVLCQCGCGGYVDIGEAYIEGHLEAAAKDKHFLYDHDNDRRMRKNRDCSLWLGCYVAETVLSKVFKNVERMPMHNPGYDFVCNQGKLVDVKCACENVQPNGITPQWAFSIKKNTTADYFLCLAFDDREHLNPIHAWLLPSAEVCHLTIVSISELSLDKWSEYEIDMDRIVACCDDMKRGEV